MDTRDLYGAIIVIFIRHPSVEIDLANVAKGPFSIALCTALCRLLLGSASMGHRHSKVPQRDLDQNHSKCF